MSYVLFLGFKCFFLKENPNIRLHINDFFIDEFDLPPTHRYNEAPKKYERTPIVLQNSEYWQDIGDPHKRPFVNRYQNLKKDTSAFQLKKDNFFKVFKIGNLFNNEKDNVCVNIKIKNNDTNYTNGFFNKTTLLSLTLCYLVPEDILLNPQNFMENIVKDKVIFFEQSTKKLEYFFEYYKKNPVLFNLLDNTGILWRQTNGNTIAFKNNGDDCIGGSGVMELKIPINLVDYVPNSLPKNKTCQLNLLQALSNKYVQYENQ